MYIDGGVTQELHLQRLMAGITTWLDPPEAVVGALLAGSISERCDTDLHVSLYCFCGQTIVNEVKLMLAFYILRFTFLCVLIIANFTDSFLIMVQ